jgi:enoyl-CoA hydratase/carnithine racemase
MATAVAQELVMFEQIGAVARLTLNRPESLNAINQDLGAELIGHLDRCVDDETIRAVLIRGSGRAFCAGDDVGGHNPTRPQVTRSPVDPITAPSEPATGASWARSGACRSR